jgi:hypothetical protein
MNELCNSTIIASILAGFSWAGEIIRSMFPWPAVVLFIILFPPTRGAFGRIIESLAESIRTLRRLKTLGFELSLDPAAAREVAAKSSAVVFEAFERKADQETARRNVWDKFTSVIKEAVEPISIPNAGFRSTIHIQDVLDPDALYQLTEYYYVAEPHGPPKTRGRRNSIRFGIIGRAWRLGKSEYDPTVATDTTELVKVWGMTHDEAVRAGRGRQTFAAILLRDGSGGSSGIIFIDAQTASLFGDEASLDSLEHRINAAAKAKGLSDNLSQIRRVLSEEYPTAA